MRSLNATVVCAFLLMTACDRSAATLPDLNQNSLRQAASPRVAHVVPFYSFHGGALGRSPESLTFVGNRIYGTAFVYESSISQDVSIAFVFTKGDRSIRILHTFNSNMYNISSLIYVNGVFYGTSPTGGAQNAGTVFSMTKAGKIRILYSFGSYADDGKTPVASLLDVNGWLYGTTSQGGTYANQGDCPPLSSGFEPCGVVFRIGTNGKHERVLHSFGSPGDGASPYAPLIVIKGILYGTTGYGGKHYREDMCVAFANRCGGTVFSIGTDGSNEQVLHNFHFSQRHKDGIFPSSPLFAMNGRLYGVTNFGGAYLDTRFCTQVLAACGGTVFSIRPDGHDERVLHSFGNGKDGFSPNGALLAVSGSVIGTTPFGGVRRHGTIFRIDSNGAYTFQSFTTADGIGPSGLVASDAGIYGTAPLGGAYNAGTAYKFVP